MGEKVTHTLELEVWQLSDPRAMFDCLEDLSADGYRGNAAVFHPEGGTVWTLEVNGADTQPSVSGSLGQVVVLFGGVLEAMTTEAYEARFSAL